jgi:hypothetical protein
VTVHAYVLIQTDIGKAAHVADQLDGLDGVALSEAVTGPYDVIVRVIQQIEGITRTITCPIVRL